MEMARFKYSAQVFGYVPKPIKQRLIALREVDPKRFGESRIIEECLERYLPEVELKAASFSAPTQSAPGKRKRAA